MITLYGKDIHSSLAEREKYISSLPLPRESCILLHTCNRTELYSGTGEIPEEVARHLFRVVSGLESAFLGETAVQGQVKEAYERARENLRLSSGLHKLFQHALRVGKRARTETKISCGTISHSKAVIEILKRDSVDLRRCAILIIGVSNVNRSVVKYLTEHGGRTVFIANRTYPKALSLSRLYGCEAVTFDKLREKIKEADIIISATSAPHLIVKDKDFSSVKPVTIFDLAVPRDIDPAIGSRPGVTLYNIEDIERRINRSRNERAKEAAKVEEIIEEEIRIFYGKA